MGKILIRNPWLANVTLSTATIEAGDFIFSHSLLYLLWNTHSYSIRLFCTAHSFSLQSTPIHSNTLQYTLLLSSFWSDILSTYHYFCSPRFSPFAFTPFCSALICYAYYPWICRSTLITLLGSILICPLMFFSFYSDIHTYRLDWLSLAQLSQISSVFCSSRTSNLS